MTISVLRTDDGWWVQTADAAARVATSATTTAELLRDRSAVEAARNSATTVPVSTLALLSPVTKPCRVIAQMTNFASHVKDAGLDPKTIPLTFFRKSSASISGPFDPIIKPAHVRLLDYEVEIGLVVGRDIAVGTTISETDLPDVIAGLVITNDVSARDIQLPQTQFYEAKSYPTFTPVGPALVLLDAAELNRFGQLRLRLSVNGEERQNAVVDGDMMYRPLQALQSLIRFQDLSAGDLILTGTPIGTALSAPPKPVEMISRLLPPAVKWKAFFKSQAANPKYLKNGDVVESSVRTDDGAIDHGTPRMTVRVSERSRSGRGREHTLRASRDDIPNIRSRSSVTASAVRPSSRLGSRCSRVPIPSRTPPATDNASSGSSIVKHPAATAALISRSARGARPRSDDSSADQFANRMRLSWGRRRKNRPVSRKLAANVSAGSAMSMVIRSSRAP